MKQVLQIHAMIVEQKWHENQQKMDLVAWQTRTIAQFIAGTVPSDNGHSPLMEFADDVTLTDYQQKVKEWNEKNKEKIKKTRESNFFKSVDPETGMIIKPVEVKMNSWSDMAQRIPGLM